MKAKYGKKNEDKKTDMEIFHGLKLISEMQKTALEKSWEET